MSKAIQLFRTLLLVVALGMPATTVFAASNDAPGKPNAPTVQLQGNQVAVSWKAVANAVSYEVYRRDEQYYDLVATTNQLSMIDPVPNVYRSYDHNFQYEIVAVGANGKKSQTSNSTQVRIPSNAAETPSNIKTTNTNNLVSFTWKASVNAVSYRIYRSAPGGGNYELISQPNHTALSFTDEVFPTLPGGLWTSYYYQISAVNALGVESQKAYAMAQKEPPELPNKPTLSLKNSQLQVSWNAIPYTAQYEIVMNFNNNNNQYTTKKFFSTGTQLSVNLSEFGFIRDTSVAVMVRAIDLVGNTSYWYSNESTITVPKGPYAVPVPNKPGGLSLVVKTDQSIVLTWQQVDNAVGYQLYRWTVGFDTQFVPIGSVLTGTSYTDTNWLNTSLIESKTVKYRVVAINSTNGASQASEAVEVVLPASVPGGNPVDPTNPTDPTDPTNPTDPIDSKDPKGPTDPTDPTDPIDPKDPIDPTTGSGTPPPPLSSGNLLNNYTFTKFKNNLADQWTQQKTGTSTKVELSKYTRDPATNNYAQQITASDMSNNTSVTISQRVPLKLGQTFRASAMINVLALDKTKVQLYVDFYGAEEKWLRSAYQDLGEVTTGFVPIQIEGVVPTQALSARVYIVIRANADASSGSVIVDDMSLSVGNGMILNSKFQDYNSTTGLPDAWGVSYASNVQTSIVVEESPVSPGTALKIEASQLANNGLVGVFQKVPVSLAKGRYSLEGNLYVTALQDAKAQVYVDFYNKDNVLVGTNYAELSTVTDQFVPLKAEGLLPENAVTAKVLVLVRGKTQGASGTIYVNNISLNFDQNLLSNSGFEQSDTNSLPSLWVITQNADVANLSETVRTTVHSGSSALRIAARSLQTGKIAAVWQKVSVGAGDTFELNGNIQVEALKGSKAQLYIDFYDKTQKIVKAAYKDIDSSTNGYVNYTVSGVVPDDAVYAKVYVILRGLQADGEGSFLIDDINFQTSRNRVIGSMFESEGYYPGIAYNWGTIIAKNSAASFELVSGLEGKAQQIVASGLPTNGMAAIYQKIILKQGGFFYTSVQADVMQLKDAKLQIYVDFYNANNTIVGSRSYDWDEVTNGFVSINLSGTVPTGATSAKLYVIIRSTSADGAGSIRVDNAHFEVY
ncbi:MAG: hypothetical protein P0Y55_13795 [Candidatus Cohnella colombiensis]|uniref:Fibronectin type-III domain-containing protein n=1 Tax=Candidatus Cohnella colombiensis TaxID=3121368 RepID=A0AA95EVS1_9BACL|nr:MAG: hypothetical protein P0Y55_13795 [Cohnella sp.]